VRASELVSLEADLPTSKSDLDALRRARGASSVSPSDIVALLAQFDPATCDDLRARPVMDGEPFKLADIDGPG
jgi:hypothetical protein